MLPELRDQIYDPWSFHLSELNFSLEDGVFRVATTAFISKVPDVKMVSTSNASSFAIPPSSVLTLLMLLYL